MATGEHSILSRADEALLCVVDIQPRLFSAMGEDDQRRVVDNSGKLIRAAGQLDIPVVVSEQYPSGLGHTHDGLMDLIQEHHPASQVLAKKDFSCMGCEGWQQALAQSGRRELVLCGMEAHICVLQTAAEALAAGYRVHIAADAVVSRHPENRANALARLQAAGAQINNVESLLFEWMRSAAHPDFKALSKLIQ
ncbi:MAG: hydrolase [Pseudomonadota bacterium]